MVAAVLVELERHDRLQRQERALSYATQLLNTNQPFRAPRSTEYEVYKKVVQDRKLQPE